MPWESRPSSRLRRLFLDGFTPMDIAEPLVSLDADTGKEAVRDFMIEKDFDLVGIRENGLVTGYVSRDELAEGLCRDFLRTFTPADDLVPDTATLTDVVKSLSICRSTNSVLSRFWIRSARSLPWPISRSRRCECSCLASSRSVKC